MVHLITVMVMLVVTYFIGSSISKRHRRRLQHNESQYSDIISVEEEHLDGLPTTGGEMVTGTVVIGADYFKHYIGGILNFFGGRLSVYEGILDRARREALVRLKSECATKGYNTIVNLRYETTFLSEAAQNAIPQVLIIAYASGVSSSIFATPSSTPASPQDVAPLAQAQQQQQ